MVMGPVSLAPISEVIEALVEMKNRKADEATEEGEMKLPKRGENSEENVSDTRDDATMLAL